MFAATTVNCCKFVAAWIAFKFQGSIGGCAHLCPYQIDILFFGVEHVGGCFDTSTEFLEVTKVANLN